MNILFYLHGECCPDVGGIERVTDILSKKLTAEFGHKCFCIFQEKASEGLTRSKSVKSFYLPSNDIESIALIIRDNKIDIIVNQEEHYITSKLYKAVCLSGQDCKIVFAYHNTPLQGAKAAVSVKKIWQDFSERGKINDLLKIACYPIYRHLNLRSIRRQYKESLLKSDLNVMLAQSYIPLWYKAAKVKKSEISKYADVIAVPNPLSFERFADRSIIEAKKKRVLILCRLYEPQKKVLEALHIWKEIEADSEFNDWDLSVVGDGPDRELYEDFVRRNLTRVTFFGRCQPEAFYNEASIYIMTSKYEGWPMTLVEAMQCGCMPLVYDSFGSLKDVLSHELDECKIPRGDIITFTATLKKYMRNQKLRREMAYRAIECSRSFSQNMVVTIWNDIFQQLMK